MTAEKKRQPQANWGPGVDTKPCEAKALDGHSIRPRC
jgi:hypothetical protein